jgi:PAS domain S-box-containing protein
MKIRSKIVLPFISVFVFIIVTIFTITTYLNDTSLTQQIRTSLSNASIIKTANVVKYIDTQKQITSLLANDKVFLNFLNDNKASSTYTYNKNQAQTRLDLSTQINKNYNEIFLLDKNGQEVLSTNPKDIGLDKSKDLYFTEGNKSTYIKSVYLSETSGQISFAISSPVFNDTSKEFWGTLVIRVNVEDLYSQIADQTTLGSTGESFLIDKNFYLLTPSQYLGINDVLKTRIETQNTKECFADTQNNVVQNYYDYRGVRITGTHSLIPEVNWCLITKADRSEIYQPVITTAITATVLTVIGIAIFITLGIIISLKISRPIEKLKRDVEEITEKGEFDVNVVNNSKDEVGDLTKSFNKMIASVASSRLEITEKVKSQTQEIVEKGRDLEEQQKAILNILEDVDTEKETVSREKIKYEALLTGIGDGVIATDNETNIIVMNPAAENILGWKKEEVIGRKLVDIVAVVDDKGVPVPESERPIIKAISDMKPFVTSINSNYNYLAKDGKKIPVFLNATPVAVNGKLIGAINIFRDITHEKDIDRMKTEFISLSSHQLRTPLSAIKWFGEMLLAGDAGTLTPEQKEFVDNIYESTERMIALVNSLLNISRIESGRIIIDPEPTQLPELVNDVIKEVRNKIDEKGQHLITSFHPDLPNINIDPKLIREVYKNLLTNSIKYTPNGGDISVFISKNEKEIVSQVTDSGYGIPEREQTKIFEKFYRGENIVKLETEGTGLGLYLVKAVIESSGGRVWFESKENTGTTFWFALPLTGSVAKGGEVAINS